MALNWIPSEFSPLAGNFISEYLFYNCEYEKGFVWNGQNNIYILFDDIIPLRTPSRICGGGGDKLPLFYILRLIYPFNWTLLTTN